MSESCHIQEWVMMYIIILAESWLTHKWVMSHTCEWVMSPTWMSHVSYIRYILAESWLTNKWVMSHTHMNESCLQCEWVMSPTWMSHVSYMHESDVSHMWMSHVSHMHESDMSHIWMSHVSHMHKSDVSHIWISQMCLTCEWVVGHDLHQWWRGHQCE